MNQTRRLPNLPANIANQLASYTNSLQNGTTKLLRLSPLMLRQPIERLLARRVSLFSRWEYKLATFGYTIDFSRKLKASEENPQGREIAGTFDLLKLEDDICLIFSSLPQEADTHGPRLLAKKAYPLARRPFLPSATLLGLIRAVEKANGWQAISLDAMGYDVETRRFRRDMKRQPADLAAAEMNEQRRQIHRMLISFEGKNRKEHMRVSLDRYARAVVHIGDVSLALSALVIPAVRAAQAKSETYNVDHSPDPSRQEMVEIQFRDDALAKYADMEKLCRALREHDGLSVTIIHLNPYLQAQVLDFLTGAAVEMAVMDSRTVSLVPRAGDCRETIPRIAAQVFRSFGEAELSRRRVNI